jgi:hypothetical protein
LANAAGNYASDKRAVLLHPLPLYNNLGRRARYDRGQEPLFRRFDDSRALLIGGSLSKLSSLTNGYLSRKEFIVVQELFETETTDFADVVLPAARSPKLTEHTRTTRVLCSAFARQSSRFPIESRLDDHPR